MVNRVSYIDPLRSGRHPFQIYLLALCIVSAVPLIFGRFTAGSIEETLPEWLVVSWGLMLFGGAAAGLIGSYWRGDYADGLTIERVGLAAVGSAAAVYSVVIVATGGIPRLLAAAIILGFGLCCLRRARDIGRIIRAAIREVSR